MSALATASCSTCLFRARGKRGTCQTHMMWWEHMHIRPGIAHQMSTARALGLQRRAFGQGPLLTRLRDWPELSHKRIK